MNPAAARAISAATKITALVLVLAGSRPATAGACAVANIYGLLSYLNGPAISTLAVNGPATFLGSRHESEQVPPQPYEKLYVRSYFPSALLMRTFGAWG